MAKNAEILERIFYTFALLKPIIMTPIMYNENKDHFQKNFESVKQLLLFDKYLLEYTSEINSNKINEYKCYDCLTFDEWNEFEKLESKLILSKK